jgi:hypothetical protein
MSGSGLRIGGTFLIEIFGTINFLEVRPLAAFVGVLLSTSRLHKLDHLRLNGNHEGYVASFEEDIAACPEHQANEQGILQGNGHGIDRSTYTAWRICY